MKLLILGGTQFVGRALVEAAQSAGHEVTLFNRGNTNPELFPDVEKLRGDRDGDLSALEGRKWDAVVDTCGYVPRIVKLSASLLAEAVEHYTFVSSLSVYAEDIYTRRGTDEHGSLAHLDDETVEEVTPQTYGALKALCEEAAEEAMPGRVLNVRAGLIVGPHDPTDRFTYWPVKIARGGEVLAPPAETHIQFIDARDLAAWIIRMAEGRKAGIYNATGPDTELTYAPLIEACKAAAGPDAAQVVHVDEAFLVEHDVHPWTELPLWLPASHQGMSSIDVGKALGDGLTFRPLRETARDTLAWYQANHAENEPLKAGLSPEREAELLATWKQKHTQDLHS